MTRSILFAETWSGELSGRRAALARCGAAESGLSGGEAGGGAVRRAWGDRAAAPRLRHAAEQQAAAGAGDRHVPRHPGRRGEPLPAS